MGLVHEIGTSTIDILVLTFPFYFTAYYLIPRLLSKNRILEFLLMVILLIISWSICSFFIIRGLYHFIWGSDIIPDNLTLRLNINMITWNTTLSISISSVAKLTLDYVKTKNRLTKTEREKLVTELNFLKAQINPHFLFNVINNTYFQIEPQNTKARKSLEQLASIMRYMLKETHDEIVSIQEEITLIRDYFELQKQRHDSNKKLELHISECNDQKIYPHLLFPLVDNCFKHLAPSKNTGNEFIRINIWLHDNTLEFTSENSFSPRHHSKILSNQIGISNLKKRLKAFYPDQYKLEIKADVELGIYQSHLVIRL